MNDAPAVTQCDVCIVGAGPSGITLALELVNAGFHVVIAEAGDGHPGKTPPDFFQSGVFDADSHPPIDRFRDSCFGGTTWSWPGRCIPFDRIDFEKRDFVPTGGWPITYQDLAEYYSQAQQYCNAGRFAYETGEVLPDQPAELLNGFSEASFATSQLERWSNEWNFAKAYRDKVENHPRIDLLPQTNCIKIHTDSDDSAVRTLEFVQGNGRQIHVRARRFVLAAGALENARLLLVSGKGPGRGIGNQNDLVGRYYTKHFQGVYASVVFTDRSFARQMLRYFKDSDGVFVRRRFSLTPEAQRRHGLLNFSAFLRQPVAADPVHGSGALSLVHFLSTMGMNKDTSQYQRQWTRNGNGAGNGSSNGSAGGLGGHLGNLITDIPHYPYALAEQFFRSRTSLRRLPGPDFANRQNIYRIHYYSEQEPIFDNRVFLSNERDAFGSPRLTVDYAPSELDRDTVDRAHKLLHETLEKAGKGYLIFEDTHRDPKAPKDFECVGGHFMGTTRMGQTPKDGVVDKNCKIFGVDNLYVAGSSLFPTCSHASPTLTLVALAARLADHLAGQARGEG